MKYLIDSSVILTILISPNNEYKEEVGKFIDNLKGEIFILDLTKIEVSNGLVYGLASRIEIEDAYRNFISFDYKAAAIDDIVLEHARYISKRIGDTVYDALYHSCSLINSMTFLTLDNKYYKKAKILGNIELIEV